MLLLSKTGMICFNRTSLFCLVNQSYSTHILREFLVLFLLAASSNGLVSMLSCYSCVMLRKRPSPLSQPSPQKSKATCYYHKRRANGLPIDCRSDHFVCRRCCPLVDGFKPTRPSGERVSTRPGHVAPQTEPRSSP